MWSDTGKRKYQCTQCYKSYLDSCSLKAHMKTHPGEKPFLCISYNMKFSGKGVLNCHMLPHTGEKPHAYVLDVTRHSLEIVNLFAIWWVTLGRVVIDVMNIA